MSKETYFKRRNRVTCIRVFVSSLISMSFSKSIFDSLYAGLILYQIYSMSNTLCSTAWSMYLVKDRTRDILLQRKFLPYYNVIKYAIVLIYVSTTCIIMVTGFKYLFPILFSELLLVPLNSLINSIESRVQNVIMESHNYEDSNFISSKSGIYSSIASMVGMGVSSLILYVFNIGAFPLWICIILSSAVSIMDDIEMSKYINTMRDQLCKYYDDTYKDLRNKTIYNETKTNISEQSEVK